MLSLCDNRLVVASLLQVRHKKMCCLFFPHEEEEKVICCGFTMIVVIAGGDKEPLCPCFVYFKCLALAEAQIVLFLWGIVSGNIKNTACLRPDFAVDSVGCFFLTIQITASW